MPRRLIDLTTPIVTDHFRWKADRRELASHGPDSYVQASWIGLPCHAFTHMDAPRHFSSDGATLSELPLEACAGPAAVVDLSSIGPDEPVTAEAAEAASSHVRAGDIALLRTAWDLKVSIAEPAFWASAPYMTAGACRVLKARGIRGIGFDFPQDHCIRDLASGARKPALEENVTHVELLLAGIVMFEYLCNMAEIRRERVEFFGLPLKIPGSDGAPIRAVALEEG